LTDLSRCVDNAAKIKDLPKTRKSSQYLEQKCVVRMKPSHATGANSAQTSPGQMKYAGSVINQLI
jgi:hypothetical protein